MPAPLLRLTFASMLVAAVAIACVPFGAPDETEPKPDAVAAVDAARLVDAESEPGSWMSYGRTYGEQRHSPLARIDADGCIRIVGRAKDIIIRGGENIPVVEVEEQIYRHPAVEDVAVVAMPDERLGERMCAYVVPQAGRTLALDELIAFLEAKEIARFKLPERLELLDDLPVSTFGKVSKKALGEWIAAKIADENG